jgi:t-SNARE complex subunit (syntaxin)
VSAQSEVPLESDTDELQKALWTNVSELRLAEVQRRKRTRVLVPVVIVVVVALVIVFAVRGC